MENSFIRVVAWSSWVAVMAVLADGCGGSAPVAPTGAGGSTTGTASGAGCDPVDDGNPCTDDVCEGGVPRSKPSAAGSACSTDGTVCDGLGTCVACLAPSDCPGVDDACQTRTCSQGQCGVDFTASGTALPTQTAGDCKETVCDGKGASITRNDNEDSPDDKNVCTDDVCLDGVPSNPYAAPGVVCGMTPGAPLLCNGAGLCVGCNAPTDCAGADDECKTRTCMEGVCGVAFTAADTTVKAQTKGDCLHAVCDGSGNIATSPDDSDLPADDGNSCTTEACNAGAPSHPGTVNGTACADGDACTLTDTCQAGVCEGANPILCVDGASCAAGVCVAPECTGTLALSTGASSSAGLSPTSIAATDLNNDGKPDLAIANYDSNTVSVLINQGDGTFAAAVDSPVATYPSSVVAADLNGDGKPDLAVANIGSGNVSVLENLGNGVFGPAVNHPGGPGPYAISAGDLDGDGKIDLAVANISSDSVSVLKNLGNGAFAAPVTYAAGSNPFSITAVDLDGDGKPDLSAANRNSDNVSVLLNHGNGTFAAAVNYPAGEDPSSSLALDLNGDGKPDLAVANYGSSNTSVLLNKGNGTFSPAVNYPVGTYPSAITAGDMNSDGSPDLLVANFASNSVTALINEGDGTFVSIVSYAAGSFPYAIAAADLNADGRPELIIAHPGGDNVSVLLNACLP